MSKISPLLDVNGYKNLLLQYNKNKNKNWKKWLKFLKTFDKPGKQGLVGIMKVMGYKNTSYVFKLSQYINYLVQHEAIVMNGLNQISAFCPHFCKFVGTINCEVEPKCRKAGNPFKIESKYPIKKDVLLCEYIDKSYKFYNYIKSTNIDEKILYSTIKQVLMAILISQREKNFTHYDLHSFNIMMKKCNENLVFLYVIDEENQFAVSTNGHYPIIIDFGFSYINDMEDGSLWPSMGHTDVGFTSDRFDWVSDPKLFLVTVSSEIKNKRNSKLSKIFRRIVRNIFHPLTIDWESGWDDSGEQSALDHLSELLEKTNKISKLFEDYEHYSFDLIQSLVILPLEEQDYSNIENIYKVFLKEWVKIENEISSPFYNLYILKGVVDSAREVRPSYMQKKYRKQAVQEFSNFVFERISEVSKFCNPKNIQYETLLCSLIMLSKCIEGVLFDYINTRVEEKQKEYDKLPLKSVEQIYAALEVNIKDTYKYNKETKICVFDCINKKTEILYLNTKQIQNINNTKSICKGTKLYNIYKNSL